MIFQFYFSHAIFESRSKIQVFIFENIKLLFPKGSACKTSIPQKTFHVSEKIRDRGGSYSRNLGNLLFSKWRTYFFVEISRQQIFGLFFA
eukprot:UN17205